MTKESFDALFHKHVLERLGPLGFRFVGKTIALRDSDITLSLIRLGGRLSLPGCVSYVLCFRHSFLRELQGEEVPSRISTEVFDYPFKFRPSELSGSARADWRYIPRNLNYPHDSYPWSEHGEDEVRSWLSSLLQLIEGEFLPWAKALSPHAAAGQLKKYGNDAWCERLWLEDYQHAETGRPTTR